MLSGTHGLCMDLSLLSVVGAYPYAVVCPIPVRTYLTQISRSNTVYEITKSWGYVDSLLSQHVGCQTVVDHQRTGRFFG